MTTLTLVLAILCTGMVILNLMLFIRLQRSNQMLAWFRRLHDEQTGTLKQLKNLKTQLVALLSREIQPEAAASMPQEELLSQIRRVFKFYQKHRKASPAGDDDRTGGHPAETDWLQLLEANVREHMADPHFNIDHLSRLMQTSRKSLYRQIRACTGMSANEYVREIRLLVAREKIESGEATNLNLLATSVGFQTANYLSRLYRERFGKSPVA